MLYYIWAKQGGSATGITSVFKLMYNANGKKSPDTLSGCAKPCPPYMDIHIFVLFLKVSEKCSLKQAWYGIGFS